MHVSVCLSVTGRANPYTKRLQSIGIGQRQNPRGTVKGCDLIDPPDRTDEQKGCLLYPTHVDPQCGAGREGYVKERSGLTPSPCVYPGRPKPGATIWRHLRPINGRSPGIPLQAHSDVCRCAHKQTGARVRQLSQLHEYRPSPNGTPAMCARVQYLARVRVCGKGQAGI